MQEDKNRSNKLYTLRIESGGYSDFKHEFEFKGDNYKIVFNKPINLRLCRDDLDFMVYNELIALNKRHWLFSTRLRNIKDLKIQFDKYIIVRSITLIKKEPEHEQYFERFVIK